VVNILELDWIVLYYVNVHFSIRSRSTKLFCVDPNIDVRCAMCGISSVVFLYIYSYGLHTERILFK
jgi:hypothetical protein